VAIIDPAHRMPLRSDIHGSPGWQNIYLLVCAIWLLYSLWRGWTNGIFRQLLAIAALIGAALAVSWFVSPVAGLLQSSLHLPGFALTALAVLLVWGISYHLIMLIGRILFKRTRDQDSGLVRFIYGMGGAFIGLIFGLVSIWAFTMAIRVMGHLAQNQVELQSARSVPVWVANLAKLKSSIELGIGQPVLNAVDPLPRDFYRQIDYCSRLAVDPQSIQKLIERPGFRRIQPKVAELQRDPEIMAAVRRGDIVSLASNPKVIAIFKDSELQRELFR
jgi:colicin V production protein